MLSGKPEGTWKGERRVEEGMANQCAKLVAGEKTEKGSSLSHPV